MSYIECANRANEINFLTRLCIFLAQSNRFPFTMKSPLFFLYTIPYFIIAYIVTMLFIQQCGAANQQQQQIKGAAHTHTRAPILQKRASKHQLALHFAAKTKQTKRRTRSARCDGGAAPAPSHSLPASPRSRNKFLPDQ